MYLTIRSFIKPHLTFVPNLTEPGYPVNHVTKQLWLYYYFITNTIMDFYLLFGCTNFIPGSKVSKDHLRVQLDYVLQPCFLSYRQS